MHPTICPFVGNTLGGEPSASAAGGLPKGEAQGIRGNANALAAQGDAVESHMLLRIGLVICTFLRSKVCFCAVRAVGCPMGA